MTSASDAWLRPATDSSWSGATARMRRSAAGRLLALKLPTFALVVVTITIAGALLARIVAPYDPNAFSTAMPEPPSAAHLLGTDALGRDQLSRLLFGARASLEVAFLTTGISVAIGLLIGLIAADFHGLLDSILMRTMDAQLSLPGIVLPLMLLSVMGGGVLTVAIALGVGFAPAIARLVRGQALAEFERDYVIAAKSLGASRYRILFRHVLPSSMPPVIIAASLGTSRAVIAEAGLSFLGVGVKPPTATWGTMLSDGFAYLRVAPWIVFVPGAAIFLLVLSFNFLGDGLRDVLDPRLRGSR